jgi:hypothetical protein
MWQSISRGSRQSQDWRETASLGCETSAKVRARQMVEELKSRSHQIPGMPAEWSIDKSDPRISRSPDTTVKSEVDPESWTTRDGKLIGVHCSIPSSVMAGTRKRYSAAFKARVALEVAKQSRTWRGAPGSRSESGGRSDTTHPAQAQLAGVRPRVPRRMVVPSTPRPRIRLGRGLPSNPARTLLQW